MKKNYYLEGFKLGDMAQDISEDLRTNKSKGQLGGLSALFGLMLLDSPVAKERRLGKQAIGFGTSLAVRSNEKKLSSKA